jgi:cyclophilin family peptidyl-prolyl cis-trans isomerase
MGNMTFLLYDDTPRHRDAFLELAGKGHFNGTLFYRVISDFMIQGGSKDSRNAPPGKFIGYGDPTKTVDDEILSHYYCKKGALCAPRQPNDINIFKQSDISQFFIIQGRKYTSGQLDTMEMAVNRPIRKKVISKVYPPETKALLDKLKAENRIDEAKKLAEEIKEKIEVEYELAEGKLNFTELQREAYTTIGGSPEIDHEYTVFGEIVGGMEVIDKIAALKTDGNNRPYTDVVINVKIIK